MARVAEFCDCNDEDLDLAFYGPECQKYFDLKMNAESDLFGAIFDAVLDWDSKISHTDAVYLIIALIYAQRSKTLHIKEVGLGANMLLELVDSIDTDLYPFIYEDLLEMTGILADVYAYHLITQLSLPDKSYFWDELETRLLQESQNNSSRVLVGSTTQSSIQSSIKSFLALVAETLSQSTPNGYLSESTIGLSYGFFEVGWYSGYLEFFLETNNMIGVNMEYEKVSNYDEYAYQDYETVLNITHSTTSFAGNYLYMASVDQFLGYYLTDEKMSVTNMVFFGIKSGFWSGNFNQYSAGDVEIHLVLATNLDSSLEISCGVYFPQSLTIDGSACEKKSSDSSSKIICACKSEEVDDGWVVGWVLIEEVKKLIEEMSEEQIYEVSFEGLLRIALGVMGFLYLCLM